MENIEGVGAEPSSSTRFAGSPSNSPAEIPESVEYVTGQRQEICFGMVRGKF